MAADFPSLDFQDFHRHELPRRLAAGNGAIAAHDDLERLGPLAFRLPEGDAFTYVGRADGVDVVEGDAAAKTVIEISKDDWQNVVHELDSAPGVGTTVRVRLPREAAPGAGGLPRHAAG